MRNEIVFIAVMEGNKCGVFSNHLSLVSGFGYLKQLWHESRQRKHVEDKHAVTYLWTC